MFDLSTYVELDKQKCVYIIVLNNSYTTFNKTCIGECNRRYVILNTQQTRSSAD